MIKGYLEQLDELSKLIPTYTDWLAYKHTYPSSAINVYCRITDTHLYIDNGISPMSFNKWKELFFNQLKTI